MLPRRQSEFTTRKGVWWWFCFLTILKVTEKSLTQYTEYMWLSSLTSFLQVHRTCGSVWLQDEKLVPVQMATSSIMSAWYDPSGITADHPPPVCSTGRAHKWPILKMGKIFYHTEMLRPLPLAQWPVAKMENKIKVFCLDNLCGPSQQQSLPWLLPGTRLWSDIVGGVTIESGSR